MHFDLAERSHRQRDAAITPLSYFDLPQKAPLGQGYFGSVKVAFLKAGIPGPADIADGRDARTFAVKIQTYDETSDDEYQEKTKMASVSEPAFMAKVNGGPYVGLGQPSARSFYIVMPVAKSDLENEIQGKGHFYAKSQGKIPLAKAKLLIAQLVVAIGHMHKKNVIHRDIKPGNALLDYKGRIMLGDFGCALTDGSTLDEYTKAGNCDLKITPPEIAWARDLMAANAVKPCGYMNIRHNQQMKLTCGHGIDYCEKMTEPRIGGLLA
jgi:serine/threonine protein kinase